MAALLLWRTKTKEQLKFQKKFTCRISPSRDHRAELMDCVDGRAETGVWKPGSVRFAGDGVDDLAAELGLS